MPNPRSFYIVYNSVLRQSAHSIHISYLLSFRNNLVNNLVIYGIPILKFFLLNYLILGTIQEMLCLFLYKIHRKMKKIY